MIFFLLAYDSELKIFRRKDIGEKRAATWNNWEKETLSSKGKVRFQVEQEGTENIREVDTEDISNFPDDRLKFPEDGVV